MEHLENKRMVVGIYRASGKGYGFVVPDEQMESGDLFIPPRKDGGAWHNDRVEAVVEGEDALGRTAGRVVAVQKRSNAIVTGTLKKLGRALCLLPDSPNLPAAVRLVGKVKNLRTGDKAAVDMVSYGGKDGAPLGTLRAVFGPAGRRESAVEAVLCRNEIEREFPPDALREAGAAPKEVSAETAEGRLDLRNETVITIDGAGAKDLDDAVSLGKDNRGRLVLGVHIADVSHYVTPGSALDREAFQRGTSVYFADQVVPMLPRELSNGICSLNPKVDRLTMSCLMTLDEDGRVVEHVIRRSIIRTAERMTYEDCNVLLRGGDEALEERYAHILPLLKGLAEVAAAQERKRANRGSLDLASSEVFIVCDKEGRPMGVEPREQGQAEKLIEQCMLAANETVAEHLATLRKPAVYRIHEKPSGSKTEGLRLMLASLGYDLKTADHGSLRRVLKEAHGKPEELAVNTMVLRSMMKARYGAENAGHFGLAAEFYCHFTSPIRRYPDLVVHRFLGQLLDGGMTAGAEKKARAFAEKAAEQASQREIAAQNAEREIEKLYMAEYMAGHVGEVFPGVVTGASRAGLFVMLACGVEGFLPAEALPEDRYGYEEQRLRLVGERTGTVYHVGMPLTVVCVAAESATGRIDLALEGERTVQRPGREAKRTMTKLPPLPGKQRNQGRRFAPKRKKRR